MYGLGLEGFQHDSLSCHIVWTFHYDFVLKSNIDSGSLITLQCMEIPTRVEQ